MDWIFEMEGMYLNTASEFAKEKGFHIRVMEQDGEPLCGTMDLNPHRVNVAIEGPKQLVVKVFDIG